MDGLRRMFFALVPDDEGLDFLTERIQLFRARGWERYGRFIPTADLHVTLRFLGEIDEPAIKGAVEGARALAARTDSFSYEIGPASLFPRVARARIVASQVEPVAELKTLAKELETLAIGIGLSPEERAFRPHVTLARLKQGHRPNLPPRPGAIWQTASEFVLFRTKAKSSDGKSYEPIERFPLVPTT